MEGWRHVRAVLSHSRSPARTALGFPTRAASLLRATRMHDLVHVHGDAATLLSLPILQRRTGVMTTHGLHLLRRRHGISGGFSRAVIGRSLARCRGIICTSASEREELLGLYGPGLEDRLVVVRNGIDLPPPPAEETRHAVRAELGLDQDDVVALFLGELEQRKDPLTAVLAAEQAAAQGSSLRLVVAGDGPLMGSVRESAGPACRVLGFRRDPDRLLAAVDIFLLPSEREGASFALLEGMGHGLAIVVADGAGNAELVGDAAVVFPVGDVGALRGVLVRLAGNPDERQRLGAAARRRVSSELSRTRMVEGIRRVYERALTAPGPGDAGAAA